jgi:hypothetical protein
MPSCFPFYPLFFNPKSAFALLLIKCTARAQLAKGQEKGKVRGLQPGPDFDDNVG